MDPEQPITHEPASSPRRWAVPVAVAALVVIMGNLVIVVLETVVVGVQTTRLVLFEFFMRFFEGKGRPFLPVLHPPAGSPRG